MKALSIINGVMDEQVHGDVERYAMLHGFLSYEPEGGSGRSGTFLPDRAHLRGYGGT